MDQYQKISLQLSERLTKYYSTSFSLSSLLFSKRIRPAIYAIYGLVRIADEIVDAPIGTDQKRELDHLKSELDRSLLSGYSSNPIIQSFVTAARTYGISKAHTDAFFVSMAMDLQSQKYTEKTYKTYIYGSAEVVGLMCLEVFCSDAGASYDDLRDGAARLGSAYQKVNFLRDLAADHHELKRYYFPGSSFKTFGESEKRAIVADIEADFAAAKPAIAALPNNARYAVAASAAYYSRLLRKLQQTDADTLKKQRVRIPDGMKLLVLAWFKVKQVLRLP